MKKIPDRWEIYKSIGEVVKGTRFLPFKVPLQQPLSKYLPVGIDPFTPEDLVEIVKKQGYNLGLVIDLTNTKKYYNKEHIERHSIQYEKIFTEGHIVPSRNVRNRFFTVVDSFLKANPDESALIGVHCTHGLNRTGYLVCRYMIDKLNREPDDSIDSFNVARGHNMERQNYLDDLRSVKTEKGSGDAVEEQLKISPKETEDNISSGHDSELRNEDRRGDNYNNSSRGCSDNYNSSRGCSNNNSSNNYNSSSDSYGESRFHHLGVYNYNRQDHDRDFRRPRRHVQHYSSPRDQSRDDADRRRDQYSAGHSNYGSRQVGSPYGSRSYHDNRRGFSPRNHPYNSYHQHNHYPGQYDNRNDYHGQYDNRNVYYGQFFNRNDYRGQFDNKNDYQGQFDNRSNHHDPYDQQLLDYQRQNNYK